jgi:hypothetical protein
MGNAGVLISMAFTEVENVMAAVIGGLEMAEGALEVLKILLHRLLPEHGLRGIPSNFGHIVYVSGD